MPCELRHNQGRIILEGAIVSVTFQLIQEALCKGSAIQRTVLRQKPVQCGVSELLPGIVGMLTDSVRASHQQAARRPVS